MAVRLQRQEILQRKIPPTASFILSEAILRDKIGGDEVWRIQLRHLRECADVPGITIQVLPLGRTTHAAWTDLSYYWRPRNTIIWLTLKPSAQPARPRP